MKDWISVQKEKPKAKQRVLVLYKTQQGKSRLEIACYIPPKTVLSEDYLCEDAEGVSEYDPEIDNYYVVEGWWEASWQVETNWMIDEEVTHWMPLPETLVNDY